MFAPALGNVRAHRIFANGIELVRTKNAANLHVVVAAWNSDLKPIRPFAHSPRIFSNMDRRTEHTLQRFVHAFRHRGMGMYGMYEVGDSSFKASSTIFRIGRNG